MNWRWTRAGAVAALGLMAVGGLGCAEEREPINRVQPDALAKSFFVGADLADAADNPEFYANGLILNLGYGGQSSGVFSAFYVNDLSIIRWDVTESYLIGRLAYERTPGSDGHGASKETNDGQIVYVFPIQSHFDIRRAYNPTTGEELNVVEENMSDRPWYEREYMRVDWSANLNTSGYDFDILATSSMFDGVTWEPLNYYVNDPNDPNAPHFEPNEGYFDVTNKAWATPGMIDLSHLGWGIDSIPACFLDADFSGGTYPSATCNPVEVTMRHSFWKVPNRDYEPADWDGHKFSAYGAFTKEREGFARNYGMTDDLTRRFISRYNIWQRSHYYANPDAMTGAVECYTPETTPVDTDPNRDLIGGGDDGMAPNGTDDECEAVGNGSRCDIYTQKCTLPYAQRQVRPVLWYYTTASTHRFFEPTRWATQDWDVAIRTSVMAARRAECERNVGIDNQYCIDNFPMLHGQTTMHGDLVAVVKEVDFCLKQNKSWDIKACEGLIVPELNKRGYSEGEDFEALRQAAAMKHTVILCHSPVQADDHPLCSEGKPTLPSNVSAADCEEARKDGGNRSTREVCDAAFAVRIGDVRHHQINVIEAPETPSPWGFGPTYSSPLTGEAISASINVWTQPTDYVSQATIDVARFVGGELSTDEVTDGTYVKDWSAAAQIASGNGAMPPMDAFEADKRHIDVMRAASRDLESGVTKYSGVPSGSAGLALKNKYFSQVDKLRRTTRASVYAPTTSAQKYQARMNSARGTETEADLTTIPMMQYAGVDGLPADMAATFGSPLRGFVNPTIQRQFKQLKAQAFENRGTCLLEAEDFAPSPTSTIGLSKVLQEKFGAFNGADDKATQLARADRMRRYLGDRLHFAVIVHEMGHTFGFRHNFVSSSNAMFYRPQYWQLRTKNGTVSEACTDLKSPAEAENCVGPRYFDPVTQNEQDNLIWAWAQSSVMDYAGDIAQDTLGLASWDFAAAKMFYGGTAAVYQDQDMRWKEGGLNGLAGALVDTIMDSFGGIVGYTYQTAANDGFSSKVIHYSQLQNTYGLINNCEVIPDPMVFKPSDYDEEAYGPWNPLIDGLMVKVDGEYSRCQERPVAYTEWSQLLKDESARGNNWGDIADWQWGSLGPWYDKAMRTRVPYPFASDHWADLGNLAVYRHDVGADPYEFFNFIIGEQEVRHIFDNYRRDRRSFSVRGASNRIFSRYNEKMRDGAKGMTLIKNNITRAAVAGGDDPDALWASYVGFFGWEPNMLASGMAFDHFIRQAQRPNASAHSDPKASNNMDFSVPLLADENGDPISAPLVIPDGAYGNGNGSDTLQGGFWASVGLGGKKVANELSDDMGDYDSQYTMNAGSYYDKVWATMILTESVDNFISDSLDDFVDARYRACSIADLLPDGYRRWLANSLTNDVWLKGPRVTANNIGRPETVVDEHGYRYPKNPLGWVSYWPDQPETCFANDGAMICSAVGQDGLPVDPLAPTYTRPIDPQLGWEEQKFLISWTLVYLPENQKQTWLDMMGIWSLGDDSDPGFQNRIEFHMPTGDVYVARTYGTEEICFEKCEFVQRGIAARILEYANSLLVRAYQTTPVTQNGVTWYEPVIDGDGKPIVLDDGAKYLLEDYVSVPDFMRQAMRDFGMADPSMKGIY